MLSSGFEMKLETDLYSISLNCLVMHREEEIGSYAFRREKYMHSLTRVEELRDLLGNLETPWSVSSVT